MLSNLLILIIHVCICIYIYTYVYIIVYMCIYIYVHMDVYVYMQYFFLRRYTYIDSQLYVTRLMSVILEDYFWFRACDVMWVQMYWTICQIWLEFHDDVEHVYRIWTNSSSCCILLQHRIVAVCTARFFVKWFVSWNCCRWIDESLSFVGSVTMCVVSMFVNSINWINIAIDWHEFVDSLFS